MAAQPFMVASLLTVGLPLLTGDVVDVCVLVFEPVVPWASALPTFEEFAVAVLLPSVVPKLLPLPEVVGELVAGCCHAGGGCISIVDGRAAGDRAEEVELGVHVVARTPGRLGRVAVAVLASDKQVVVTEVAVTAAGDCR